VSERPAREMLALLPPDTGRDLYGIHQAVWKAVAPHLRDGRAFIFWMTDPTCARVRSEHFGVGRPQLLRDGWLSTSLVTALRSKSGMRAVDDANLGPWLDRLAGENGLRLIDFSAKPLRFVRGHKGRLGITITLPVRDVRMRVKIEQRAKAELAWHRGIGRGKRFGFGMLRA